MSHTDFMFDYSLSVLCPGKNNCDGKHKVYICRVVSCPTSHCPNRTCLQRVKVCPDDIWPGWSLGPCTAYHCPNKNDSITSASTNPPKQVTFFPNPVHSSAIISFDAPISKKVTVKIFDPAGKLLETLRKDPGENDNQIYWDASRINAGVYGVLIQTETSSLLQKITVIR